MTVRVSVSTGAHTSGLYVTVNAHVFSAASDAHIRLGSITMRRISQDRVQIVNDGFMLNIVNAHMFGKCGLDCAYAWAYVHVAYAHVYVLMCMSLSFLSASYCCTANIDTGLSTSSRQERIAASSQTATHACQKTSMPYMVSAHVPVYMSWGRCTGQVLRHGCAEAAALAHGTTSCAHMSTCACACASGLIGQTWRNLVWPQGRMYEGATSYMHMHMLMHASRTCTVVWTWLMSISTDARCDCDAMSRACACACTRACVDLCIHMCVSRSCGRLCVLCAVRA